MGHPRKQCKTSVGNKFGLWEVVARVDANKVECLCTCGTKRVVHTSNLTSGKTKSCGCDKSRKIGEKKTTHGMTATTTYSSWSSMMTRCYNEKSKSFVNYGARGIRVCERWHVFEAFLEDMGEKPKKGMSIERINNEESYEPGNCKWASPLEQARNTRRTRLTVQDVQDLRDGKATVSEMVAKKNCCFSTAWMAKSGNNWKSL